MKLKNIQRLANKMALHEFVGDDSPERVKFESAALAKILQPAGLLSWALRVFADPSGKLGVSPYGPTANRTTTFDMGGEIERFGARWALIQKDPDHGRNDLASFLDNHQIPNSDVFAANLILVVQGSSGDRASAKQNRVQLCDRRKDSRATNLDRDLAQARCRLLGRILPGASPFWRSRAVTNPLAQGHVVKLDDGAIGLVTKPGNEVRSSSSMAVRISSAERHILVHWCVR